MAAFGAKRTFAVAQKAQTLLCICLTSSGDRWRLGFPLYVLYRILDPVPLMESCNLLTREHLIGLIGGLNLCACTVKPDELAGSGLNLSFFHPSI